jgi:catechol 2,3-dioxygenase-like lactoylglutathione lyase family enzyme
MAFNRVHVTSLAHVHYQHPDLEKSLAFFKDFGLIEESRQPNKSFLRGNGSQPYLYVAEQSADYNRHFIGAYWNVASFNELEIAKSLPEASDIEDNDGPGGGKVVRVKDPHGFVVGFLFGQTFRTLQKELLELEVSPSESHSNTATEKFRQGPTRRFRHGPSPVHKLGHYGIGVPKASYKKTMDWYMTVLNLKATDVIFDPKTGEEITCFAHIDLGPEYTDHHVSYKNCRRTFHLLYICSNFLT